MDIAQMAVREEETKVESNVKVLKREPGLGRLNRLIAASTATLLLNGHDNKRFKRDYTNGVALYTCSCGAVAAVGLGQGRGETHRSGDAFETFCSKKSK